MENPKHQEVRYLSHSYAQSNDYTVSVTNTTRIIQTVSATVNDLKRGLTVSVIGTPINQGSMTAQHITISLPGTLNSTRGSNS